MILARLSTGRCHTPHGRNADRNSMCSYVAASCGLRALLYGMARLTTNFQLSRKWPLLDLEFHRPAAALLNARCVPVPTTVTVFYDLPSRVGPLLASSLTSRKTLPPFCAG